MFKIQEAVDLLHPMRMELVQRQRRESMAADSKRGLMYLLRISDYVHDTIVVAAPPVLIKDRASTNAWMTGSSTNLGQRSFHEINEEVILDDTGNNGHGRAGRVRVMGVE